jgi:hypothetical protein
VAETEGEDGLLAEGGATPWGGSGGADADGVSTATDGALEGGGAALTVGVLDGGVAAAAWGEMRTK